MKTTPNSLSSGGIARTVFFTLKVLLPLFATLLFCSFLQGQTNEIFSEGTQWKYIVKTTDTTQARRFDTLILQVKKGSFFISQQKISWSLTKYKPNGIIKEFKGITGVVEDSARIWLHPPRLAFLKFTELTAFPEIKFPIKSGKTWSSTIHIGKGWGKWENEKVKSKYEIIGKTDLEHINANFSECYEINAVSVSKFGEYETSYCFNPKYGFVYFKYVHPDCTVTEIVLEEVINK